MSKTMEARPTEYKGIRYRSKSEAMFARWLELTRIHLSKKSSSERGAYGFGCGWVYEPDWLRVGNWTPDFYCWSSQWMPALYLSIEIIEYKPSMPTDTYIEEMASNVGLMQRRHGEAIQLYYGSPFNTDRGVYHFLDYEGSIRVNHSPCDWLGGLSDVIASFRYDLEAN